MPKHWKRQGIGATLIVLIVVATIAVVVGIVVWLRMGGHQTVPTQPTGRKPARRNS